MLLLAGLTRYDYLLGMDKANRSATGINLALALLNQTLQHFIGGQRGANQFCLPPDRRKITRGQVIQLIETAAVRGLTGTRKLLGLIKK